MTPTPSPDRNDTGRIRKRHESQITEQARRIQEHAGYMLKRAEAGRAEATGLYAQDIAASVQRILISVAALEKIKETTEIMATSDEPPKETGQ